MHIVGPPRARKYHVGLGSKMGEEIGLEVSGLPFWGGGEGSRKYRGGEKKTQKLLIASAVVLGDSHLVGVSLCCFRSSFKI